MPPTNLNQGLLSDSEDSLRIRWKLRLEKDISRNIGGFKHKEDDFGKFLLPIKVRAGT